MRLWSIHPQYLDAKGLVALWREALLAQKVLRGLTKGYTKHPQLVRFRTADDPIRSIAFYLQCVADEAEKRSYHFDRNKIENTSSGMKITVTSGQLTYEFKHLLNKLKVRDPERYMQIKSLETITPHPLFHIIPGGVEEWENIQ